MLDKIILFGGIILNAITFVTASYYFRYGDKHNQSFPYIFFVSIIFGIISYSIKVPVLYFFGKNMSVMLLNIIILITIFITVTLYSYFILNEHISMHTYIIITIIILLIILNNWLDFRAGKGKK